MKASTPLNSLNSQSEDTKLAGINPVFKDLNEPDTIINDVEEFKRKVQSEQKAKTNPFPVEVFPLPIQQVITATNENLNFPIDFIAIPSILLLLCVSSNSRSRQIHKRGSGAR